MKDSDILLALEAAAKELDVKVSYESIGASVGFGGLCRVKGQYRAILDKRTATGDRVEALASMLAAFEWTALELASDVKTLLSRRSLAKAS